MNITAELPCACGKDELLRDYESAKVYDKVRVGECGFYFSKLSGAKCLPYSAVLRAELRAEEFAANCCCGISRVDLFILNVTGTDGKVRKIEFRLRSAGEETLRKISAANPAAEIIQ